MVTMGMVLLRPHQSAWLKICTDTGMNIAPPVNHNILIPPQTMENRNQHDIVTVLNRLPIQIKHIDFRKTGPEQGFHRFHPLWVMAVTAFKACIGNHFCNTTQIIIRRHELPWVTDHIIG
nr:MAG TPA: hypothetical protein [Caudoviricetes sp.]